MTLDEVVALPVLSIRQPWASYVASGLKSVELRSWPTRYRGWLWIHAGKQVDAEAFELLDLHADEFLLGGLVGIARLDSCELIASPAEWYALRNEHRSPGEFHSGIFAWRFSDAIGLPVSLPVRGQTLLFHLDTATRQQVRTALESSPLHADFVDALYPLVNSDTSLPLP